MAAVAPSKKALLQELAALQHLAICDAPVRKPDCPAPCLEARSPSPNHTEMSEEVDRSGATASPPPTLEGSSRRSRRRRQRPHPSLFLGNLPSTNTVPQSELKKDLQQVLATFGQVVRITLKSGFAFVDFAEAGVAETAAQALRGQILRGKAVVARVQTEENLQQARSAKAAGKHIDGTDSPTTSDTVGSFTEATLADSLRCAASVASSVGPQSTESSPVRRASASSLDSAAPQQQKQQKQQSQKQPQLQAQAAPACTASNPCKEPAPQMQAAAAPALPFWPHAMPFLTQPWASAATATDAAVTQALAAHYTQLLAAQQLAAVASLQADQMSLATAPFLDPRIVAALAASASPLL